METPMNGFDDFDEFAVVKKEPAPPQIVIEVTDAPAQITIEQDSLEITREIEAPAEIILVPVESEEEQKATLHKRMFGSRLAVDATGQYEKYQLPDRLDANYFDDMLFWLKERGASDIVVRSDDYVRAEVAGKWLKLSYRVVQPVEIEDIIRTIVSTAAVGSLQKGRDIDKSYQPRDANRMPHRFRMNITAIRSINSESISYAIGLRTLPTNPPTVSQLEIEADIYENFRISAGLNLITGATGSGKSTMNYSLLRYILEDPNTFDHIIDFSKPIEYTMDGLDFPNSFLSQTEVGVHLRNPDSITESAMWQYAARNGMRRKPNHIVVGETRDKPTMELVLAAALSGHLTTTTLHTYGCALTIQRILRWFSYEERLGVGTDIVSAMNLVINQMLVKSKDGSRKYAVREYILFNDYVKSRVMSLDNVEKWPGEVQNIMNEFSMKPGAPVKCMTMLDHAQKLFHEGLIAESSLNEVRNKARGHKSELEEIGEQDLSRDVNLMPEIE